MGTPARGAVVAAVPGAFSAAAVGVGAAVGPVDGPEAHPASAAAAPAAEAGAGTGYVLDVLHEQPAAGTATVEFRVLGLEGAPVTEYTQDHGEDLHLVEDEHVVPAPGPHVGSAATAPSAGTHRLFLDSRHGDTVHTAASPVQATGTAADEPAGHGHGGRGEPA